MLRHLGPPSITCLCSLGLHVSTAAAANWHARDANGALLNRTVRVGMLLFSCAFNLQDSHLEQALLPTVRLQLPHPHLHLHPPTAFHCQTGMQNCN